MCSLDLWPCLLPYRLRVSFLLWVLVRASPCGPVGALLLLCGRLDLLTALLAASGRPLGPLARRSCPAGSSSACLEPPQGPGALLPPPRVSSPATRFGVQAASARVRAPRASVGRCGFAGRRPVWSMAPSPGGVRSCPRALFLGHWGRPCHALYSRLACRCSVCVPRGGSGCGGGDVRGRG